MLLREVEYARPSSLDEALRILGSNDGAAARGRPDPDQRDEVPGGLADVLVDLAASTS